ncbi:hypothetical protein AJ79_07792 [Helicocarpus griseus UAMH5409]|uniref:Uncharacterized protein n=1 Tax=Helicocarpus griseus UAMH5409 TaxID=1447875 RepID=A0A2B7WYH8_9EURO|nr:hypothetical protein AJ79_07792 [Helicocarpus griseus UAMH5409]
MRPTIPPRSLSKRNLEDALREVNDDIKKKRRVLKPKSSFGSEYWTTAAEIEGRLAERNSIRRQISLRDFVDAGGKAEDWASTEELKNWPKRRKH